VHPVDFVIRTKLAPPFLQKYTLYRPRITQRLLDALNYRLTLVQAGTGYGKTTALAALTKQAYPFVWQQLDAEDADPQRLLLYLIHGFRTAWPDLSEKPLLVFEEWSQNRPAFPWTSVVDALVNALVQTVTEPSLYILDDAHYLNEVAESMRILDRLIGRAPGNIHFILSTRYPLQLPTLNNWQVKGAVLQVGQSELAFTPPEVEDLFRDQYNLLLTPEQTELLIQKAEGWAIALYLIWQHWQRDDVGSVSQALGEISGSAGDLLAYLTQEVISKQPEDVQEFFRQTSVLRQMDANICNYLREAKDSGQILRYLLEEGLFVVDIGNGTVRYHHLIRDLLISQHIDQGIQPLHLKAAAFYRENEDLEEAVYHLLAADAFHEAATLLDSLGRNMVRAGRLDTLANWIRALPPNILVEHPPLLAYLGDCARLHSRFDEAMGWYQQAEERSRRQGNMTTLGQALRGQARVYLDTVNPSKANQLLQEALRLADGQEDRESHARLLELLAENILNQGKSDEAAQYQAQARELRQEGPGEAELPVRLLLRTGRLDEARQILEKRANLERQEPVLTPRAHRETLLLLSIILAFQGEQGLAYNTAVEGTKRGQVLDSQYITAVGQMRQGHAWLLDKQESGYEKASQCFRQAIELSDTLLVPRIKIEAYWGLCQAYGFRGELKKARQVADLGISMAQSHGDEWIEALLRVTMGAAYYLDGQNDEAITWLTQANTGFIECGDSHGQSVARLWSCLIWHHMGNKTRLNRDLNDLLELTREHSYDFLFKRNTLLGPPDPHVLIPLLLFAHELTNQREYSQNILNQMGLGNLIYHPGFQLRVQTLGAFRVWQGDDEISSRAWRRKKAQELFQLLLTYRDKMLDRDQITELLWPESAPDEAERNFKVTYSTLCRVLEPDRDRNAPSAFVLRDGRLYGLRQEADVWFDVLEFNNLISQGDRLYDDDADAALPFYQQALSLYDGDYLQENLYDEWCSEARERLSTIHLQTSERVALILVNQNSWEEAIKVCQTILKYDNCWEQAYRLMMTAYHRLGNRAQVMRTYQKSVENLRTELGVEPTDTTVQLFQDLLNQSQTS